MFRSSVQFLLTCLALVALSQAPVRADDADPKKLEAQLEKLLEAYNKNDTKAFFANWATSVKSITTESMYNGLYKDQAKKTHGDYKAKSIKFRKEGSVLSGDFLVVYFEGEFAKEKAGVIAVNFQKENGEYKFMQVQIQKKK